MLWSPDRLKQHDVGRYSVIDCRGYSHADRSSSGLVDSRSETHGIDCTHRHSTWTKTIEDLLIELTKKREEVHCLGHASMNIVTEHHCIGWV